MNGSLRAIPCEPFQVGWEGFALSAEADYDQFRPTPDVSRARHDRALAAFSSPARRPTRFLPGEPLYWSALLVNETAQTCEVEVTTRATGGEAMVWYQLPWVTEGRALLPEKHRYLVPELLLKHDRLESASDLTTARPGYPDHADARAPVRLRLPPGGFAKCFIKVLTTGGPLDGVLEANGAPLFRFQATPLPLRAPETGRAWIGLYYALPKAPSDALFMGDLAYLQEMGTNTLIIHRETLPPGQLDLLAAHGIKRLILSCDKPDLIRATLAEARARGMELLYYTKDEPHYSDEALREHLRRTRRIREGGARTMTAISRELYERPLLKESLDVPNFALWSLKPPSRAGRTSLGGLYYWQCAFERPVVNRYLAGFFCHYLGADGYLPFVYRDNLPQGWAAAYTGDTSPLYQHRFREHLMAYPSEAGPIRTIQSEAMCQGIADWRLMQALKNQSPAAYAILMRQLEPAFAASATSKALQNLYNGRERPTLAIGPVDMLFLSRVREKVLDLLAHGARHTTRFDPAPSDPADVRIRYDATSSALRVFPDGLKTTDFPLCLIEGFDPAMTNDEIATAMFGPDARRVQTWIIQGS